MRFSSMSASLTFVSPGPSSSGGLPTKLVAVPSNNESAHAGDDQILVVNQPPIHLTSQCVPRRQHICQNLKAWISRLNQLLRIWQSRNTHFRHYWVRRLTACDFENVHHASTPYLSCSCEFFRQPPHGHSHQTRPLVQRLLWMFVRRTTAQGVDVTSNTVRDASTWSSIVPSVSACLEPSDSSSMTATLRYFLVCNASSCGDVVNTSSSLFLTDGVVTPLALSKFNDLTINSACRGSARSNSFHHRISNARTNSGLQPLWRHHNLHQELLEPSIV